MFEGDKSDMKNDSATESVKERERMSGVCAEDWKHIQ